MNKKEVEDRMRIDPEYRLYVSQELIKQGMSDDEIRIEIGKCYEEIINLIDEYMEVPEDYRKLVALWIIGTYFHNNFSTYPFLFINAMRGSGKTRLLNIISHLSKGSEGKVQTGITEAVLFRTPKGKTMVLDECESLGSKDKAVLREYLNACYKKGGVVERARKNKEGGYDIETFYPFKPIAMANIWGMEEVLGDRCITIILEKSNNPVKTKKLENFSTNPKITNIKRTLERFSVVCVVSFRTGEYENGWNNYLNTKYKYTTTLTTYNTLTTLTTLEEIEKDTLFNKIDGIGIDGRNFELLFPFLMISNYLSPDLLEEVLKIGKSIMDSKKDEEIAESRDVSLYDFISTYEKEGFIPVKELTNHFKLWLGEDSNEHINDWWMGKALKRLNLVIEKQRVASGMFVRLNKTKAKEKLKIFKTEEKSNESK